MSSSHPSGLAAGDRVRFRSRPMSLEQHVRVFPGATVASEVRERHGTLIDDPQGEWVRIQYDDQPGPDSALVETLTRIEVP